MNVSRITGKRIIVVGSPGAGKSTISRAVSSATGLPLFHLDRLYWKPGWVPVRREKFLERVRAVIASPAWIIDGNYQSTFPERFEAADTVIFLDFSRIACIVGALRRLVLDGRKERPDMTEGCEERFNRKFLEFLLFIWSYQSTGRKETVSILNSEKSGGKTIYVLHNRKEANSLMRSIASRHPDVAGPDI
ncbi:MAG: topology modulation protein [Thermoplasmata archaeon]|uniref:Topology modulation protein n=1 Tax=Candidatus Sysuiplasma superficiale TaxID=2823368 RepID=A0A8J8CC40_9ARCH|nr:topology modulation protein [Candidatus Sysuiplasma superficiale]